MANAAPRQLGILLFTGFEVLDVFGPLECFSKIGDGELRVNTVAREAGPVASAQGTQVVADYAFDNCPALDWLLVPGGIGVRTLVHQADSLDWIRGRTESAALVMTVCTGTEEGWTSSAIHCIVTALLNIAWVGTVTWGGLPQGPSVRWVAEARWVQDGKFVTSSGISAGTDMALAVIADAFGLERAEGIADILEWNWQRDPACDPFAAKAGLLA